MQKRESCGSLNEHGRRCTEDVTYSSTYIPVPIPRALEKLAEYDISPEGGRAVYLYPHYSIVRNYSFRKKGIWALRGNIIGTCTDHYARWWLVARKGLTYDSYLQDLLTGTWSLPELERYIERLRSTTAERLNRVPVHTLTPRALQELAAFYYQHYSELIVAAAVLRYVDRGVLPALRRSFQPSRNVDDLIPVSYTHLTLPTTPYV